MSPLLVKDTAGNGCVCETNLLRITCGNNSGTLESTAWQHVQDPVLLAMSPRTMGI